MTIKIYDMNRPKRFEKVYTASRDYVGAANMNADARVLKNPNVAFVNATWDTIAFGGAAEYLLYRANDELIKLGIASDKREVMLGYFNHFKEKLYDTNTGGENLTLDFMYEISRSLKRNLDGFINAAEKNIRERGIANSYALASLSCAMKIMEETEGIYNLVVKPLKRFGAKIPRTMGSAFTFLDLSYYKAAEIVEIIDPQRRSIADRCENTCEQFSKLIAKLLNTKITSTAARKAIEQNEKD